MANKKFESEINSGFTIVNLENIQIAISLFSDTFKCPPNEVWISINDFHKIIEESNMYPKQLPDASTSMAYVAIGSIKLICSKEIKDGIIHCVNNSKDNKPKNYKILLNK